MREDQEKEVDLHREKRDKAGKVKERDSKKDFIHHCAYSTLDKVSVNVIS